MKIVHRVSILLLGIVLCLAGGCNNEDALREKISVDGLRVLSIGQMKDLSSGTIHFKVTIPSVVMSTTDNYDSDVLVVQDDTDPRSGIRIKGAGSHGFGEKVLLNLDGVEISVSDNMHTIVLPDASFLAQNGGTEAFASATATTAQFRSGNLQSMYVALGGFQCIDEELGKKMTGVVKFQNIGKDTISVFVNPSSSLASSDVPEGSGTLKGVVKFQDGEWMLLPQQAGDFNLTEPRFRVKSPSNAAVVWSEGSDIERFVSEASTNEMSGAVSLDAGGTQSANCYVVSATGTYSFFAKNALGVYPAGIPEGTVIYVNIASLGGNAVVAYVDPATEAILWTWHIWASETSLDGMAFVKTSTAEDGIEREITMLDRLLGATSTAAGNPKANGLYFQWGRKDAFPGPNMIGDWAADKEAQSEEVLGGEATAVTTVNADLAVDWTVAEAAMPTSQAAAALPTTLNSTQTWTNTPGGQADTWTAEADPCPYGWHVPSLEEAKAILGVAASTPFAGMDTETTLGSVIDGFWWPNNGDRARKNGRLLSLGRRHFSWINSLNGNSGYTVTVTASSLNPAGSFNRGNASGVRCVRDYKEGSPKENGAIVWSEGGSLTGIVSRASTMKIADATNLDAGGTQSANCYVVAAPGVYSFAAKAADGSVPEGIPEGTTMYVEVAAVPGNAVVAYVDDAGSILWSWHIWAAGTSLAGMEKTRGSVTMLDRLLGATGTTPGIPGANGLYYQWGRKDAFPGPNMIGAYAEDKEVQSEAELNGDATAVTTVNADLAVAWNVSDAAVAATAQAACAIPTTFLSTQTWSDTPGGAATTWTAAADPCPYGWHVPTEAEGAAIVDGLEANMDTETSLGSTLDGVWWPSNGDRARKNGRLVSLGRRHFSWINSINATKEANANYVMASSSSVATGSFNRGNATGVRCVKNQ